MPQSVHVLSTVDDFDESLFEDVAFTRGDSGFGYDDPRAYETDATDLLLWPYLPNPDDRADTAGAFLSAMSRGRPNKPAHQRFVHPAALARHIRRDRLPRQFAILGFPGSGNRIMETILGEIYRHYVQRVWPVPPEMQLLAQHIISFPEVLNQHLQDRLGRDQFAVRADHASEFGKLNVRVVRGDNATAVIWGIDCLDFVGNYYSAHVKAHDEVIETLRALNYTPFVALRNPLDTLISRAAKIRRPPEVLVDDRGFFLQHARAITEYHRLAYENRRRVVPLRYEQLLRDPVGTIKTMGRAFGVRPSNSFCHEVWEQYGFKSVTAAGDIHLYQPGEGKYRTMMTRAHYELLAGTDFFEKARLFGYEYRTEEFASERPLQGTLAETSADAGSGTPSPRKAGLQAGADTESGGQAQAADEGTAGDGAGGAPAAKETNKVFGAIDHRKHVRQTCPATGLTVTAQTQELLETVLETLSAADTCEVLALTHLSG